ncbi:MAG: VWA domain-containing protein, partial [Pirellulales bacterium]
MSKNHWSWLTCLAIAGIGVCTLSMGVGAALSIGAEAPATDSQTATMDLFSKADGETSFALKLVPGLEAPPARAHDVVILFDTSASQTGVYRSDALKALEVLLAGLGPNDRAALLAVDLKAVALTGSMVAPNSEAMQQALSDLRRRVPLGSTDMATALSAVVESFGDEASARGRSAVYIGDGMSTANLIASGRMQELVDELVAKRVSVSSYAIGPRLDNQVLGALANHTGGMLAIDGDSVNSTEVGNWLAEAARGAVVWPTAVEYPESLAEVYPRNTPPLRFDRDTVVIGKLAAQDGSPSEIRMRAEVAGKPVEMSWQVRSGRPSDDHAYLDSLVRAAKRDGGVGLPTVGTAGLKELRWLVNTGSQNLTRLSQQALATGDLQQAEQLVAEATRLDPLNANAQTVQEAVRKARENGGPATPRDLRLANFQDQTPPPGTPEPVPPAEPGLPGDEGGLL